MVQVLTETTYECQSPLISKRVSNRKSPIKPKATSRNNSTQQSRLHLHLSPPHLHSTHQPFRAQTKNKTPTQDFTLTASPNTDIWHKPTRTSFNAPTHLTPKFPLSNLLSARLTFTANWQHQYDQGGLLLLFYPHTTQSTSPSTIPPRWLKTGIEFFNGSPTLSTVACETYIDMSLYPFSGTEATIEVRRQNDALWVYWVKGGEEKVPIRELGWVFVGEGDVDVQVGAWAARPGKVDGEGREVLQGLEVGFWGLEVERR